MKYDYHLVVIGAGSAGLVAAASAAYLGARVALIEGEKMGGDCLNYGCVPSKSFLHVARQANAVQTSSSFGLSATLQHPELKNVMDYVRNIIREIEPHDSRERFEGLGVKVYNGTAKFKDLHTIAVGKKSITGKRIIIATGSEAALPDIPGLSEVPYLTNRTIFDLETLPKHLIILGAGSVGLELGQGFRFLGSEVSIVDMSPRLFPKEDGEVGPLMETVLKNQGIRLYLSSEIKSVRRTHDGAALSFTCQNREKEVAGDRILVALGRRPVTSSLGLQAAGIEITDKGYIRTNQYLQTSAPHIYACGDITGRYQFTHMAGYEAGIAVRNCIFPFKAAVDYSAVPWVTYTQPEVAHAGATEEMAKAEGNFGESIMIDLARSDRARTEGDRQGFLKLVLTKGKRIAGVTIVARNAGEMIGLGIMAVKKKMPVTAFMSLIFPYPTESEMYRFASLEAAKRSFQPWMKTIIKRFFL